MHKELRDPSIWRTFCWRKVLQQLGERGLTDQCWPIVVVLLTSDKSLVMSARQPILQVTSGIPVDERNRSNNENGKLIDVASIGLLSTGIVILVISDISPARPEDDASPTLSNGSNGKLIDVESIRLLTAGIAILVTPAEFDIFPTLLNGSN
jgi:hypothetical protein